MKIGGIFGIGFINAIDSTSGHAMGQGIGGPQWVMGDVGGKEVRDGSRLRRGYR